MPNPYGPPPIKFKLVADGFIKQLIRYDEPLPSDGEFLAFLSQAEQINDTTIDLFFELQPYQWTSAASIGDKRTWHEAFGLEQIPGTEFFMSRVVIEDFLEFFRLEDESHIAEGSWYMLHLSSEEKTHLWGELYDSDDESVRSRLEGGTDLGDYSITAGYIIGIPQVRNNAIEHVLYRNYVDDYDGPFGDDDERTLHYLSTVMNSGFQVPALNFKKSEAIKPVPDPPSDQPFFSDSLTFTADDPNIRSIGMMNVGAANCALLFDKTRNPVAYFDFGYPLPFYTSSAPAYLRDQSLVPITSNGKTGNDQLFVVLSHWDWDHWRLGALYSEAEDLPWIFGVQPLGSSAVKFLSRVKKKYHIPKDTTTLSNNKGFILKTCTPSAGMTAASAIMNNTGLAIKAQMLLPIDDTTAHGFALTGDCNFDNAGLQADTTLSGILAVHHGSSNHGASDNLPSPVVSKGRIVYSCGINASGSRPYGFPRAVAVQDYIDANWGITRTGTKQENGRSTAQGNDIASNTPTTGANPGNIMVGPVTGLPFTLPSPYNTSAFSVYKFNLE